jgi:hypothetical protein
MDDLADRLRQIENNTAPDLWGEITTREVINPRDGSRRGRRGAVVVGALAAIAAVAIPLALLSAIGDPATRPSGLISDTLVVSCTGGETTVLTPAVRLQGDGLHARVEDADPNVGGVLLGNTSDPGSAEAAWRSGSSGGIAEEFVRDVPSGDGRVLCFIAGPMSNTHQPMLSWPSFRILPAEDEITSPEPTYLPAEESWSPATYPEGDRTVMPVTFPDGTTAEIVYPVGLGLEGLNVYPATFADGGPYSCGWSVSATRSDPREGWITGNAPLATHTRDDGSVVELWDGGSSNRPHDFLVFRAGAWTALLPCRHPTEPEMAIWADNLHASETPDGLLVIGGSSPVVANPYHDQDAPVIRMSDQQAVLDISVGSTLCDQPGYEGDTDVGDGVVQWCLQREGGIWVYANADGSAGKEFLVALVGGLAVREVEPPEDPGTSVGVPDLWGKTVPAAKELLQQVGLVFGEKAIVPSNLEVRADFVIGQDPPPGTTVPIGTAVDVEVPG